MAKIKEIEITLDGEMYLLKINCSSKGIFTCKIPHEVSSALNIYSNISGATLQEVENQVHSAYSEYLNATKTVRLVVAVQFRANRKFTKDSKGNLLPAYFADSKFLFSIGWSSDFHSVLAFGYKICIEETINGNKRYYHAVHESKASRYTKDNFEKVGDYYREHSEYLSNCEILDYSESLVNNLQSIENQLRNASEFLSNLFTNEESMKLLSEENIKLLK